MNKYALMLEFNTILDKLKEGCFLEYSKNIIDKLELKNDIDEIQVMLEEVDEAFIILERYGKFPIYIKSETNIEYLLNKIIKNGVLTALELVQIGDFLDTIRDFILYKNKLLDAKIECLNLNNVSNNVIYNKDLNLKIKKIVSQFGEINDDASPQLKAIRKKIKDIEKAIQSKILEIMQKNGDKLSSSTISIRNDRYVIPVKSEYKNQIKGIIHDQSSSGETTFVEPQIIVEMSNNLNQAKESEKKEIEIILKSISNEIACFYDEFIENYSTIVNLDIIFGKAKLAKLYNCSKPKINNKGIVKLKKCYHPLLNVKKIVTNDITIGVTYKGIIITGPNTGGKTVLLKTVGLLSLMVKFGLLIPCENGSEIAIFDNVFADIGDEQSISQNLSTFSSHLKNVIDIINNVSMNSLVLIDELGSGTDPIEGSSLAIAIIDHLINKNCTIITTSHYSELKMHAYSDNKVINASVEFDVQTLSPTYRLLIGVPGMSNALNIASRLGLNKEIIQNAQNYVSNKNDNLSVMLDKLVTQSNELDKHKLALMKEKEELDQLITFNKQEVVNIQKEKEKIIIQANLEKDKIIEKSKKQIEDLIYEIDSLKNKSIKPHEISDLKHKVRTLGNEDLQMSTIDENFEYQMGMQVFVKGYNSYGKIVKTMKNDYYEVQMGIATVKVHKEDLQISETKVEKEVKYESKVINLKKSISSKLDLRGCRYEEANDLIEKFLDDALYGGLQSVTIIHGFGTGTIRKLVHEKLKKNKYVEEYHYGGQGEGGQGATIVNLKK